MNNDFTIRRISMGVYQRATQRLGWILANETSIRVYMFHSIDSSKESLHPCSITKGSFTKWINRVLERGERLYSLEEISSNSGGSYITFDDIYESVYVSALPILEKYNIPFTCFVAPGLVGTRDYINRNDLSSLANNDLCTIGAHSVNHKLLSHCNSTEARTEIYDCKKILESWTDRRIDLFAYPYGSAYACKKREKQIVFESGYKMAFSTVSRPLRSLDREDSFFLPRISVEESNWKRY